MVSRLFLTRFLDNSFGATEAALLASPLSMLVTLLDLNFSGESLVDAFDQSIYLRACVFLVLIDLFYQTMISVPMVQRSLRLRLLY